MALYHITYSCVPPCGGWKFLDVSGPLEVYPVLTSAEMNRNMQLLRMGIISRKSQKSGMWKGPQGSMQMTLVKMPYNEEMEPEKTTSRITRPKKAPSGMMEPHTYFQISWPRIVPV